MAGIPLWLRAGSGGLFAQGNFGIVTKMGFRLMPLPEYYRIGLITVPRRRDFAAVASKQGGPSDAEMDAAADKAGLPSWQVDLQFFGPEATTRANWDYARDRILSDNPGAEALEGVHFPLPATEQQLLNTTQPYRTGIRRSGALGVPSLGIWRTVRDDGHVGFFPILARSGRRCLRCSACRAMREFGLNSYFNATSAPLYGHTFAFQMVFAPSIRKDDAEHNAMVHRAMKKVIAVAAEHGWGDYRAAPIDQDDMADTYSFNNHQLRRFHEQLKDAIDPDGIIAPGRGGIWPRRFRQ